MGDWLAEHFTLMGVPFQNWMVVAVAIIPSQRLGRMVETAIRALGANRTHLRSQTS
jgi:hypothetical protein